jgi:hypothetical protein
VVDCPSDSLSYPVDAHTVSPSAAIAKMLRFANAVSPPYCIHWLVLPAVRTTPLDVPNQTSLFDVALW